MEFHQQQNSDPRQPLYIVGLIIAIIAVVAAGYFLYTKFPTSSISENQPLPESKEFPTPKHIEMTDAEQKEMDAALDELMQANSKKSETERQSDASMMMDATSQDAQ